MALWVVRAGRHGEQETTAVKESVVCHAWNEIPDCSKFETKDDLREVYEKINADESGMQLHTRVGQVWRFAKEIEIGDLVALPLKSESAFEFGRITSDYQYKKLADNVMHIRHVKWLVKVPRSVIPKDILNMMNSALTVFQVTRNDAETRIKKLLESPLTEVVDEIDKTDKEDEEEIDLAETARDQIIKAIQSKFTKHDLTRLVDAVLRVQGYQTEISPAGPDGGVDILAGSGPLGLQPPRLCVQVKSGAGAEGQKTFNELVGVVTKFDADQGLLVSWGGFTNAVHQDAKKSFFKVRLWDQGKLVDAVLENYERLGDEIKAELPMKRIWVLVTEDGE
jgi:restriction system protein